MTIERAFRAGAQRVIVGTRALEDADWRRNAAAEYPGRIVVAADVRNSLVLTRGWTHETALASADDVMDQLNHDPLAAVLVTDVGREGRMTGIDEAVVLSRMHAIASPCVRSRWHWRQRRCHHAGKGWVQRAPCWAWRCTQAAST